MCGESLFMFIINYNSIDSQHSWASEKNVWASEIWNDTSPWASDFSDNLSTPDEGVVVVQGTTHMYPRYIYVYTHVPLQYNLRIYVPSMQVSFSHVTLS
jgi:hypothetical protein